MHTHSAHLSNPLDIDVTNPVTASGVRVQQLAHRVNNPADFQFLLATAAARFQLPVQAKTNTVIEDTGNIPTVSHDVLNNAQKKHPLSTQDRHYQYSHLNSQYVAGGQFESLKLHLLMHPEPLSLYNNPYRLDEDILANGFFLEQQQENSVRATDPTALHDIYIKP